MLSTTAGYRLCCSKAKTRVYCRATHFKTMPGTKTKGRVIATSIKETPLAEQSARDERAGAVTKQPGKLSAKAFFKEAPVPRVKPLMPAGKARPSLRCTWHPSPAMCLYEGPVEPLARTA